MSHPRYHSDQIPRYLIRYSRDAYWQATYSGNQSLIHILNFTSEPSQLLIVPRSNCTKQDKENQEQISYTVTAIEMWGPVWNL
jgi:hypothetical protein